MRGEGRGGGRENTETAQFRIKGEFEIVVSSEYFGCAHISTWFCVLRFHTRMVASRDPLRTVGPQG